MTRRDDEQGMILINVLMFVAIASGLVLLMIGREELALDRALRSREAARAAAIVRGGELSAIAALQRDALAAPEVDHAGEAWASIGASGAAIDGGTFDLAVSDAEGRFNVNSLRSGDAVPVILFQKLAAIAGLDEQQTVEAIAYVRSQGPVTDIRPIRLLPGVDAGAIARLERMVTALPGKTTINLNAADEELLAFLFADPVAAQRLVAIRKRNGQVTLRELSDLNITQPPGTGFASNTFWVRVRATIGDTAQQGATLIQRRKTQEGGVETVPVARWRNAAVPPEAPAFPVRS
ncbi:Type II secretory pathway component PulK-like protein [Sphingomonas sp. ST-64]|uniref:Type II secretion system protein K n=1 Tax=Sphingomonas plantiphila TaxID=3163295 RepID=A0ABW8YTC3_9SPHN